MVDDKNGVRPIAEVCRYHALFIGEWTGINARVHVLLSPHYSHPKMHGRGTRKGTFCILSSPVFKGEIRE